MSERYKSMYKNELADAAGVSIGTFRRWIKQDEAVLFSLGCKRNSQLLNPAAVKYLCEKYVIEIN